MAKGRHDGDVSGSESGESSVSTEFTGGIESGDSSNSEGEKFIRESIVKQEERAVQKARLLVAITVIALTVSVSTAVFYFASQSDQATFELAVSAEQSPPSPMRSCLRCQRLYSPQY